MAEETRSAVRDAAEAVSLSQGEVLERIGEETGTVYFPQSGVISTLTTFSDGTMIEMANVGREACTGVNLVLGNPRQLTTEEVQIPGEAWRLPVQSFSTLLATNADFRAAVQAAGQSVLYQVMISGACNGLHSARQRLARWLLTMRDRAAAEEMDLTHDFLASVLGLRRATVSEVAAGFRRSGLIDYGRGRIRVTDPAGLEAASCDCYRRVREANEALLPPG